MITESRVRRGLLRLTAPGAAEPTDFSCQPTSIAWTAKAAEAGDDDVEEVLCGDTTTSSATAGTSTWTLDITAIQDFEDPAGLIAFSHEHDGEIVTAEVRLSETAATKTAQVRVWALSEGGGTRSRLTSEASWPCQSKPTVVPAL